MGTFVSADHITDLYNFKPAVKSLYTVEIYDSVAGDLGSVCGDKNSTILHASQIALPSDTLKLERHSVTKNFTLSDRGGYEWSNTLTITWREDSNWSVRKYHQEWLDYFYDKSWDTYLSTTESDNVNNRYKSFKITLPNGDIVWCRDVIPQGPWNLDLAWGNSPSIVSYSIVYTVGWWSWGEK